MAKGGDFDWGTVCGIASIPLAVGGMSDMPLSLRVVCFVLCAVCVSVFIARHKAWSLRSRVGGSFLASSLMLILIIFAVEKSSELPPGDPEIEWLKNNDEQQKLLLQYPLGYTIFEVDSVTSAVTPLQARQGLEAYEFNFAKVRITEDNSTHISMQLPDVLKDGKPILTDAQISGDKLTMLRYGAGYFFGDGSISVLGTGQVLQYKGNQVIWIFGLRQGPSFPPPPNVAKPKGDKGRG